MKHKLKVIGIGVCLGILLGIIRQALQIDRDVFLHWYWIVALLVLAGVVLINVAYNISYQRKMKEIAALLDSGKEEEYLAGVEGLLRTAKGKGLRNILKINLSAGYLETKQYDKAVHLLEELSREPLRNSVLKLCRSLNLGMSYFYTKQYAQATGVYTENQELFERYRNHKVYGASIALAYILTSMMQEQYEQAARQLDTAQKTWDMPRFQRAFQEIRDILATNLQ